MSDKMNLPVEWEEIKPKYWAYKDAFIGEPIDSNKFLLVSWRMSGSEFCKELIRENYPEATNINYWAKTHRILETSITERLIDESKTKVFVIISDPREVAVNLIKFENGLHLNTDDYPKDIYNPKGFFYNVKFLNAVTQKQINLIEYYSKIFGDDCIVLRYEDAFQNQKKFHKKVSRFLGYEPLGIDDVRKYKWSIYKNVGNFKHHFHIQTLTEHYNYHKSFYEKWEYPFEGIYQLKYGWHIGNSDVNQRQLTEDYQKMLTRNAIPLSERTEKINEF